MTAGRDIKQDGATGSPTQGADDNVKGNDKKAADKASYPRNEQPEGTEKADPRTPAQYSF